MCVCVCVCVNVCVSVPLFRAVYVQLFSFHTANDADEEHEDALYDLGWSPAMYEACRLPIVPGKKPPSVRSCHLDSAVCVLPP